MGRSEPKEAWMAQIETTRLIIYRWCISKKRLSRPTHSRIPASSIASSLHQSDRAGGTAGCCLTAIQSKKLQASNRRLVFKWTGLFFLPRFWEVGTSQCANYQSGNVKLTLFVHNVSFPAVRLRQWYQRSTKSAYIVGYKRAHSKPRSFFGNSPQVKR